MSRAKAILEKIKKSESSMNSLGAMDKKAIGIVENIMKKKFGGDNQLQLEMCAEMKKLAEMDSKVANDFMEYMDDMSSKYEMDMGDTVAKDKKIESKKKEEMDDEEEEDEMDDEEEEEEEDDEGYKKKKKEAKK
jgi:ABC-type microcin C transport system permease subunit YejB